MYGQYLTQEVDPEAELWCGGKRLVEENSLERKGIETGQGKKMQVQNSTSALI